MTSRACGMSVSAEAEDETEPVPHEQQREYGERHAEQSIHYHVPRIHDHRSSTMPFRVRIIAMSAG